MMEESQSEIPSFQLGGFLGEGASGKVYAVEMGDTTVALKVIKRSQLSSRNEEHLKKEIDAMRRLDHPNIIRLLHADLTNDFQLPDSLGDSVRLFIEIASNGELFDYLKETGPFREELARFYFKQLLEAIQYCHAQGVFHRDLKPENLLLDAEFNIKVADFGLCAIDEDGGGIVTTVCGTKPYMAPEVLKHRGYTGGPADVWSLGVILFAILSKRLPFKMASRRDWHFAAIYANRVETFWEAHMMRFPDFSEEARNLITRMFTIDPAQRPSAEDLLSDPWFDGETMSEEEVRDEMSERAEFIQQMREDERERAMLKQQQRAQRYTQRGAMKGVSEDMAALPHLPAMLISSPNVLFSSEEASTLLSRLNDHLRELGCDFNEPDASNNYTMDIQFRVQNDDVPADLPSAVDFEVGPEEGEEDIEEEEMKVHVTSYKLEGIEFILKFDLVQGDSFEFSKFLRDIRSKVDSLDDDVDGLGDY
jgi:serine/threonine protein kinase